MNKLLLALLVSVAGYAIAAPPRLENPPGATPASVALKVDKAGDTMTGRLTAPDATLTYGLTAATGSFSGGVTVGSMTIPAGGVLVSTSATAERVAFFVNPANGESSFGLALSSTTLMSRRLTVGFDPNVGAAQGWYNTATSKISAMMQTVANDADFQLYNAAGTLGIRLIGGSSLNSYINNGANFAIGTASPCSTCTLHVAGGASVNTLSVNTTESPASGAACSAGKMTWDASYIYVCTASGAWKRSALTGGY